MASSRLVPVLLAGGVGVLGGIYIWNQPLQELSGKTPNKNAVEDGRSSAMKSGEHKEGASSQPHSSLKYGGASPVDQGKPTVAGTSAESRKTGSADHNVKTRDNAKEQDGTSGGGVGVAEMRERKMAGQGLPSPQGGDSKPQKAQTQRAYSAEQ